MKRCKNCKNVFLDSFAYCNLCGSAAPKYPTFGTMAGGFGKGVLYVLYFMFVQAVVSVIYSFVLGFSAASSFVAEGVDLSNFEEELTRILYSRISEISIVSSGMTIIILVLFFVIIKQNIIKTTCANVSPGIVGILVAFLGVALNYVTVFIGAIVPVPEQILEQHEQTYSYLGQGNFAVEFIAVAVCAPIVEELIFRALCYGSMRKVMPVWAAILFSSAVFGISHGNPLSFVYTSLLGVLLAYFYEFSGSVWVPILLHFGFNGGSYIVSATPEKLYIPILFGAAFVTVLCGAVSISYYTKRYKKKKHNEIYVSIPFDDGTFHYEDSSKYETDSDSLGGV